MPMYNPDHVEYDITSGNIQIAMEDGSQLPAYWAHPNVTSKFPGVVLIHDWWGVISIIRRMANLFAQVGYYVIVPDLFNGQVAQTPEAALQLVDELADGGYKRIHTALSVLETHHKSNANVAAVGLGMGGSLAYEAAIMRPDLEAAVAYGGFPQRYLGHYKRSNTPMLAFYGTLDPYIPQKLIAALRQELAACPLPHEVVMLEGSHHEIFSDSLPEEARIHSRHAWHKTLDFLEGLLEGPTRPPERKVY